MNKTGSPSPATLALNQGYEGEEGFASFCRFAFPTELKGGWALKSSSE